MDVILLDITCILDKTFFKHGTFVDIYGTCFKPSNIHIKVPGRKTPKKVERNGKTIQVILPKGHQMCKCKSNMFLMTMMGGADILLM